MNIKSIFRLSYLAIFAILVLQGCEDNSFGEDFEVQVLPSDLSYPDILNAREYAYIESAPPSINTNSRQVRFEIVEIRKDGVSLDESYMASTTILNPETLEYKNPIDGEPLYMKSLYKIGQVIIEDGNPFENGEYFFTIKATAAVNGKMESVDFIDALRLQIGPELTDGISYCPFKMNFVSGESTTSEPVEVFGGNPDIRFELGSDSDKLSIDPATGAISLNSSYTISETETINPIVNVVSNISEEVVSFEGTFTAILSATPVQLDKVNDYFYFPSLAPISRTAVNLGGNEYDHQVVDYHTLPENNWFNKVANWRAQQGKKWIKDVPTPDAAAVRADAGVSNRRTLEHPFWTINAPSESWITMNAVNLALYEGCFDSKAVFWYKLNLSSGYEVDGSTPIGLEVHISNNYTGDVTTTDWTQVNDILECEINANGTVFTGSPYPGDQSGLNPDGLKDPAKNANNLWVRCELNLEDYKSENAFTLAFRLKTYYDNVPSTLDSNGNPAVNGGIQLSNVHFVASEK